MAVNEGGQLGLGEGANLGRLDVAALEQHQGGDATNSVFGGGFLVFVDVQLGDLEFSIVFLRYVIEDRCNHFAGTAPFSPVVDQYRASGLQNFGFEVRIGDVMDMFAHGSSQIQWDICGLFLRFYYFRFFHPWVSSTLRDFRNRQSDESESDIRHERLKYNPKSFNPEKFYDKDFKKIFLGIDSNNDAVYVPASTWLETNMMITGPTRYGKGIVIGCLMEQAIIRGDQLIYIDPKNDKFAAKIMLQT